MPRRLLALALALTACVPTPLPTPDAQPDAAAEAAADAQSAPDAEPPTDAAMDAADVAEQPDAQLEASSPDVVDAGALDSSSDAAAPPDINARQDTMELRTLMRRTCGAGFTEGCDEIQSLAFEASCSVRGTRFSIYLLPCARGLRECGEVFANVDGTSTSISASASIGGTPTQGFSAVLERGIEWVDGMGQRRQNFYVRAQLAPSATGIRGITGVAGRTTLPDYADFYALGCPKGP